MSFEKEKKVSFEDSLRELQDVVELLEDGNGKLEDIKVNYEKGIKLITHCRSLLESAECSIQKLQPIKSND